MRFLSGNLFILLIFGFLIYCTGSKNELVQKKPNPDQNRMKERFIRDPEKYTKKVLADRCRIIGTIKEIDSTRFLDNPKAPCGKYPCYATIVIDSILGYGSGFSSKVSRGQEIEVNFKFTLISSDITAPELQLGLPGLQKNNQFIADLEALPIIGEGKVEYTIYRYELKSD